jgi:transcriptional regulator with XRE-family HTH domain
MNSLRKIRKLNNITMKELGEIVGVAESTISLYETGKRQPDFNTLQKLATYFNTSLDFLLFGFDRTLLSQFLGYVMDEFSYDSFAKLAGIDSQELLKLIEGEATTPPSMITMQKIMSKNENDLIVSNYELLEAAGYLEEARELELLEKNNLTSNSPTTEEDFAETIAAHADEDLTEDEQQKVQEYIKFLKSQRSEDN